MSNLDKIDNKIIEILKEEKGVNLSRLTVKVFARETNQTFMRRLQRLKKLKIIDIEFGLNGKSYLIKLRGGYK